MILLLACSPPASCPPGEVVDSPTGTCVPETCGTREWGDLDVDGAFTVGGSGAYASIQDAADAAGEAGGGLVALAAGTYLESLDLGRDHHQVEIAGRCRELVVVDGSGGEEDESAVRVLGTGILPNVTLRGLTITGGRDAGLWVEDARVSAERVTVRENSIVGVLALGGEVRLTHTEVLDTLPDEDGEWGRGIDAEDGATLTAQACTVERNRDVGVYASGVGTVVRFAASVIADTQLEADGTGARASAFKTGRRLPLSPLRSSATAGSACMPAARAPSCRSRIPSSRRPP